MSKSGKFFLQRILFQEIRAKKMWTVNEMRRSLRRQKMKPSSWRNAVLSFRIFSADITRENFSQESSFARFKMTMAPFSFVERRVLERAKTAVCNEGAKFHFRNLSTLNENLLNSKVCQMINPKKCSTF